MCPLKLEKWRGSFWVVRDTLKEVQIGFPEKVKVIDKKSPGVETSGLSVKVLTSVLLKQLTRRN